MNYKVSIAAIAIFSLVYLACSKPDQKTELPKVELYSQDKVLTKLTLSTQSYGIESLIQDSYSGDEVTYTFKGQTKGKITYKKLNDHQMSLSLQRMGDEPVTVVCDNAAHTMVYQEAGINLLSDPAPNLSLEIQTQLAMSLSIYTDITPNEVARVAVDKKNFRMMPGGSSTCHYTAISIRQTKSSSVDHLNDFVNEYLRTHPQCAREHGVDSGCLWGDYACISTQEIVCSC